MERVVTQKTGRNTSDRGKKNQKFGIQNDKKTGREKGGGFDVIAKDKGAYFLRKHNFKRGPQSHETGKERKGGA